MQSVPGVQGQLLCWSRVGEQGKGEMPGHVRLAVPGKDLGFHSVLEGTSHTTGSQASLGCRVEILRELTGSWP